MNRLVFSAPRENSSCKSNRKITRLQGWEDLKIQDSYFYAEFSRPFVEYGTFDKIILMTGLKEISVKKSVCLLKLNDIGRFRFEVRIGNSCIDEKSGEGYLNRETKNKSFNEVKNESFKIWNRNAQVK